MKSKIVLYNGHPIKLTRKYAESELKNSLSFIERLKNNIESDRVKEENKQSAHDVLVRRNAWVQALREYLETGNTSTDKF